MYTCQYNKQMGIIIIIIIISVVYLPFLGIKC